jgi:hypothetical protein
MIEGALAHPGQPVHAASRGCRGPAARATRADAGGCRRAPADRAKPAPRGRGSCGRPGAGAGPSGSAVQLYAAMDWLAERKEPDAFRTGQLRAGCHADAAVAKSF